MISKEKISFDPTDADSLAASDVVGARLLVDDGTDPLTGGNGSADDIVAANIQGLDVRAFSYLFDGTTFDRLRGTSGAVHIHDGGNTISVDDSGGSLTVDATDLDIRDLAAATDSVSAWLKDGAGTSITSTTAGAKQAVDVNIAASDIEINVEDDKANSALVSTQKTVTTASGALLASQQANRRFLWVQNLGNAAAYIGASGVTDATGIRLSSGAIAEFRFGPAISLHAVTANGTADTRILEAA